MKSARVKLTFPEQLVRQPIVGRMVQQFGVLPNIRRASVEEHVGWMICEIDGEGAHVDAAVSWLVGIGVQVDRLSDVVES
jgi:ABC-type methionine transport system ATPase subunit